MNGRRAEVKRVLKEVLVEESKKTGKSIEDIAAEMILVNSECSYIRNVIAKNSMDDE